jgi:hypothetical protein
MTPNRRTLLGAVAGGVAALAGCGYRPGGGEFRWSTGSFHRADGMTLDDGTVLLVAREAMSYDFETGRWYRGGHVTTLAPRRGERTAEYGFATATRTAALGDGVLYAGQGDGTVTAVPIGERADGGPGTPTATPTAGSGRWTTATGVAPSGIDALDAGAGAVYAGGGEGLAALSPGGDVRWRWADGAVAAAVAGEGGTAVYVLAGDRLVALAGDGAVRWTRAVETAEAGTDPTPPVVGTNGVYLADDGGVTALAHGGSVRWERDVAPPVGRPALAGDGLYHASVDGVVRAFSPDGRERWAHEPRGTLASDVAAADGRAFVLAGGELVGVGAGGTAWRVPLDDPEPFTPEFGPFAVGETLVLGGAGEVRGYWRSQLRR